MTSHYEYKVVPAPVRGQRGPGVKGAEARFAHALEVTINEMAAEGWEYQRAETLPSEERQGLASTGVTYRNLLIFRRPSEADLEQFAPELLEDRRDDDPGDVPEGDETVDDETDATTPPAPAALVLDPTGRDHAASVANTLRDRADRLMNRKSATEG